MKYDSDQYVADYYDIYIKCRHKSVVILTHPSIAYSSCYPSPASNRLAHLVAEFAHLRGDR